MKTDLKRIAGKWRLNGKLYPQMSQREKEYFSSFIKYMKQAYCHE